MTVFSDLFRAVLLHKRPPVITVTSSSN
eukprot:COSAG06_NODE_38861_length_418_cov_286.633229_1_plen_27_part_01